MNHVTRGTPAIASLRGVALYERKDGTIHHIHRVATLEGAEEPSAEEMERRARKIGAECGLDEGRLLAAHFDPRELEPDQRYRVDLATKQLVSAGVIRWPEPQRGSRR